MLHFGPTWSIKDEERKTFIRCYIWHKYENMTLLSQKYGEKQ